MRSWFLVIGALALGGLWISFQDLSLSMSQPSGDSVIPVADTVHARQSVVSHHPGLTAVTVRAEAPYPPDNQPVTLVIRDADTKMLVVSVTVPFAETAGSCIDPCGPTERGVRFLLPRQEDSERRTYIFDVLTEGAPLYVDVHTSDMYSEGQSLGPTGAGDLVFRLDYNGSFGTMTPSVSRQIAAGRPGIAGAIGWVPGLVLVYVLIVALVLRQARTLFTGW